jgi:hypothetical protein
VSQTRSSSNHTLGATLERDRLEHRVGRIAVAVAVLRQRASERRRGTGSPPQHIGQTIADFETQIAALTARTSARTGVPTPVQNWSGLVDDVAIGRIDSGTCPPNLAASSLTRTHN